MLPYTPLHHLLLERIDFPVVTTSGNLSDEPICTDERDAVERLRGVADLFLVHDRPIARHVDDSVAWTVAGEPRLLRRARGYAPRPVPVQDELPVILALGAHLKNTVALSVGRRVFVSQHIGDMETPQALEAFERVIADFLRLYEVQPVALAHDLHPDYASTRWVADSPIDELRELPRIAVQHHHAHLASCLAEHGEQRPALGVIWDGTGYGTDGTVWGGEFLVGDAGGFRRFASLRPFRLPGGDAAIREPRRVALAILWELMGESGLDQDELPPFRTFDEQERRMIFHMLERRISSPLSTSMGRLFDGVAALAGLCQRNAFEGQAAMMLEWAARADETAAYPFELRHGEPSHDPDPPQWTIDWRPTLAAVLEDLKLKRDVSGIAARFHNTWVDVLLDVAGKAGQPRVALSGGCFQNRRLVEHAVLRLRDAGFHPLLHRQVPPNDGGISLGQLHVAAARIARGLQEVSPCV
jgi:hydrogenase maturation protein HypF